MGICGWLSHWASWSPQKVAVRFDGQEYTYATLDDEVGHLAGVLRGLGVESGKRVGYLGNNSPVLLELLFACARLGSILVPFNARMPSSELRVFLGHSNPRVVVVESGLMGAAIEATAEAADIKVVPFGDVTDENALEARMRAAPYETGDQPHPLETPVVIAYTSGTTGVPKGAVLTQGALLFNALNAVAAFDLTRHDEVLTNLPMYHVGGLNILTTPAMSVGATVTIHQAFDPAATLQEVQRRRTTLMISVPAMSRALAGHPVWTATDLSSLRCVVTGSTAVAEGDLNHWFARGIAVCQVYGLTETTPIATVVPIAEAKRMGMTAGKPAMYCRVRIIDERARALGAGGIGEVALRGPNVMREYWRNRTATREAFADGWFRTGDAGFLDKEGFLHIVGRLKDIIVVGGSNVYPADLEHVLAECSNIREAAVVGRPDADLGEVPVAFVELEPDRPMTAEMVMRLFDCRLAPYKHPHEIVFVDALPRTALGKVNKTILRERVGPRGAATDEQSGTTA